MKLPRVRTDEILAQKVGNEALLYNGTSGQVFCLDPASALVFQACNDGLSAEQLKDRTDLTDEQILLALEELSANGLIDKSEKLSPFTRREALGKMALAALAIPAISALVLPTPAAAASTSCTCDAPLNSNARPEACPCNSNADCCGVCLYNGGNPICSGPTTSSAPTAAACCPPPLL